jgi:hypothetical protein
MKKLHLQSIALGIVLGIICTAGAISIQHAFAEETNSMEIKGPTPTPGPAPTPTATTPVEGQLTPEEMDKKLEEILESQKALQKRLETILVQTRFLKASSGK